MTGRGDGGATGFETIQKGGVRINYRPGSAGEQSAKPMASAAARARRALEGFGAEPDLGPTDIYLDDAFPDPDAPDTLVTEGTVVDDDAVEVWMVAAPESPPEPPHRALALLFAAGFDHS